MPEQQSPHVTSLVVETDHPLIAVPDIEDGQEVTRYFVSEEAVERAMPQTVTQEALKVVGAWCDLDWQEMEEALDRIRHESMPTPPIEL